MKIYGDQQAAAHDSQGKIGWKQNKSKQAGNAKQDPVAAGDKFQYALLNFHLDVVSLSATGIPQSRVSQLTAFFYGQSDIAKAGHNSNNQKNQRQPGRCLKSSVQIHPQEQSDENGQGNRQPDAAEIGKILDVTSGFSFHS